MKTQPIFVALRQLLFVLFVGSAPFFIGCTSSPDPQPAPVVTPPGSGTTTTPGSGTTTTPGSGTTTAPGTGTTTPGTTVIGAADYIKQKSNLTFLSAAIAQAGLAADVNKGGLTIFAPSDDAFKAAGYASVAAVSAAPAADLKRILQYHVVGSVIDLSAFPTNVNTSYQTTLTDSRVTVYKVSNTDVSINGAKIVEGNIATTNTVVHIINQVLMPPTLGASDLIQKNTDLSLFAAAVTRAGSTVQTLLSQNSQEGITIFAPNNAAFKAAGYTDAAAIQAADPKVLADLLSYHVLNYRAFSQTFQNGAEVVTAQGTSVRFTVSGGKLTITGKGNGTNAANLVQADLVANNGVVHVIDRVLLPK